MTQAPDAAIRERALDARRSFCVNAPAGSGKTELLTQRILRLLAECGMPEELLAITFTRKATAEMRRRLLQLLLEAQEPEALAQAEGHRRRSLELAQAVLRRDREQGWGLLQNPGRLRISTIDGLCHWLSRSLPLLSGLGGLGRTLQSVDDGAPLRAEALRHILREMEQDNETAEDLSLLMSHLDNRWSRFEALFGGLLDKRLQWLRTLLPAGLHHRAPEREDEALQALQRGVAQLRSDMLARARALLQPYETELRSIDDQWPPPPGTGTETGDWRALCELLLTQKNAWRKQPPRDATGAEEGARRLKELLSRFRDAQLETEPLAALRLLPEADFSIEQVRILGAVARLLRRMTGHLQLTFRERGEIDHSGVALAALEALGAPEAPSELALRLGCRIRHILVDEFQDTSQAQFELLERLTRGWAEHNEQHPDAPRTLFAVGDGMQSCYGFRDADVGLFLQVREQGVGGMRLEPLELKSNFRSQQNLVDWCNKHFPRAFPDAADIDSGAAPFFPAVAVRGDLDGPPPQLHFVVRREDDDIETARRREAERTAELVLQAQREAPQQGGIAILLRSRAHARHILAVLQEKNIACQTEAMHALAEQTVTQDLLSLSCALLDPWDRFSWLAILRAPWCGLDARALHAVAGAEQGADPQAALWPRVSAFETLPGLSAEDRGLLRRFCAALQPAQDGRARRSLRRRVEGAWFALGGPACLQSEAQLRQAQDFFALLESFDGRAPPSAQELEEQTGQLYAAPEHLDAQVQLMTMHKAKGLEFDTVILPCLDRSIRSADKELLLGGQYLGADGGRHLLMAACAETGAEDEPLYRWLQEREKKKSRLETRRLFYIACTRAVRRLHLLACVRPQDEERDGDAEQAFRMPAEGSMARILWEMEQEQELDIEFLDAAEAEPAPPPGAAALQLRRLPADWRLPAPPPGLERAPAETDVLPAREERDPLNEAQREDGETHLRQTGIVLHDALESIATETAHPDDAGARIQRMRPVWRAQLRQSGVPAEEIDPCLALVEEGVRETLADEQGRWLLSAEREDGAAELSLQSLDEKGALRTARVDRCFVADGERWIIDYKSARPAEGQSREDFLALAERRYGPQLRDYAQLFRSMEPERRVRTALYFPLLPLLHELPEEPSQR